MMASSSSGRFASLDKKDIDEIIDNIETKNTKRQNNTAVKLFREYLSAKNMPCEFEDYPPEELDDALSLFYLEMRNKDGERYKKTTMHAYRQGIQRHLEKCKDIDIRNQHVFKKSTKAFKGMTKELKRVGLAAINHHPAIEDGDIEKMYEYFCQNLEDARLLQYKVFVDIMLHFGRRGRENLASLTRKHFAAQKDVDGRLFVYQSIDERTKNHQSDSEVSADGRMYEIRDSDRCPVRSFVKYVKRLNPKCVKLFQQARSTPKDGIYFDNIPLGHNRLGQLMTEISKTAQLSKVYTNHSCRATTVSVLDAANVPSRHIMTVTGHRSETSLKSYSGKTSEQTKKKMSEILSEKTIGNSKSTKTSTCISNVDFLCLSQSTISVEENTCLPLNLNDTKVNLELLTDSENKEVMDVMISMIF